MGVVVDVPSFSLLDLRSQVNSSDFWQCSGDTGFARFGVSLGICLGWMG